MKQVETKSKSRSIISTKLLSALSLAVFIYILIEKTLKQT